MPARLDWLQSITGLLLALFMWGHMLFVSSILISPKVMWTVTRMFEGYFIFGRSYPWIVSVIVATIGILVLVHAALAMRKFPASYQQYRSLMAHSGQMQHADTWLWVVQAATGFALMFLVSVHLYQMLMHPAEIGPFASAERVYSGRWWPLYLLMLFCIELHAGIGLYRLAVKWGWFLGPDPERGRRRLKALKWGITCFMLVLGIFSLVAYFRIGALNADQPGLRYQPPTISQDTRP